jgi:signal transduction histidine kinase
MVQELERLNQEKDKVVASIGHEMMTPLTSILLSTELMVNMKDSFSSDSLSKLMQSVDSSARSIMRRISDLSDYIKMEHGRPKLNLQSVDIEHIVGEVVNAVYPLVQSKQQSLSIHVSSLPRAKADPSRLEQVLYNLITNASKFSSPKSTILLRAQAANSHIKVEIEDEAPLIDPDEYQLIFQPYYRGRNAGASNGLGLGLTICKRFIEVQGGTIGVKNTERGNCFHFSLPIANELKVTPEFETVPRSGSSISRKY